MSNFLSIRGLALAGAPHPRRTIAAMARPVESPS
jgi:hypothetical protein